MGRCFPWTRVRPNGTNLVIDLNDGKDKLSDKEIDELFIVKSSIRP